MQTIYRSRRPKVLCEKDVLKDFAKFTGKHLCQILFLDKVAGLCNFIKKETPAQVFSCKFCEIFENTSSYKTLLFLYVKYVKDLGLVNVMS